MTDTKMTDYFIGPKAENISLLQEAIVLVLRSHEQFRQETYPGDPSLLSISSTTPEFKLALQQFLEKSRQDVPFFHPRYMAQMLKDPCIPAIVGYFNHLLLNPNNHAYEGGPVTTGFEIEVIQLFLNYLGFDQGWGHITSGGTLANLEALWVIKKSRPTGKVVFSNTSHFAWRRICDLLSIDSIEIPCDEHFRLSLPALEEVLKKEPIIAVIANLGSTGTGSVDDIAKILALRLQYDFHLHVDAAYGGFTRTIILDKNNNLIPYDPQGAVSAYLYDQLCVLAQADSITVDPHKHGLISYGAGAIFYRDKQLQAVMLHDAPYTYHNKTETNLGQFALEGSRPGAIASACYLTYQLFPLHQEGMGKLLSISLNTANHFHALLSKTNFINLYEPDLDICCFYPKPLSGMKSVSDLNQLTLKIYTSFSINTDKAEFILSKFILSENITHHISSEGLIIDEPLVVLRAVLFKPWLEMNDHFYIRGLISALNLAYTVIEHNNT